MTSIEERVSIASKQFLTFSDTCRLLSVAYRTLKPDWDEFLALLKSQGKRIPKYGVKASLVLDYFDVDYDQLMREYNFDKIKRYRSSVGNFQAISKFMTKDISPLL